MGQYDRLPDLVGARANENEIGEELQDWGQVSGYISLWQKMKLKL